MFTRRTKQALVLMTIAWAVMGVAWLRWGFDSYAIAYAVVAAVVTVLLARRVDRDLRASRHG